ncbi:hypothetical protein VNO78_33068 [Psophocarpus tetragonolobus]|uniref:Uncharacterized protein n=1 Tax=Psophocarpus tetragonolobus TaxID=3891 RepID=A0AAN9RL09_PSOTE
MEGHSYSSQGQAQHLGTKLNKMLQNVVEMFDDNKLCIYKVPQKFRQSNPEAYTPGVVSIGPYHKPCDSNGKNKTLKRMEKYKLEYLQKFFERDPQLNEEELFQILIDKEEPIRSSYAEPINCSNNDFLTMILVDACFIIEHFLRCCYTGQDSTGRDPLLLEKLWMEIDVHSDLTLLENQIPFFVLEEIFNFAAKRGMNLGVIAMVE